MWTGKVFAPSEVFNGLSEQEEYQVFHCHHLIPHLHLLHHLSLSALSSSTSSFELPSLQQHQPSPELSYHSDKTRLGTPFSQHTYDSDETRLGTPSPQRLGNDIHTSPQKQSYFSPELLGTPSPQHLDMNIQQSYFSPELLDTPVPDLDATIRYTLPHFSPVSASTPLSHLCIPTCDATTPHILLCPSPSLHDSTSSHPHPPCHAAHVLFFNDDESDDLPPN